MIAKVFKMIDQQYEEFKIKNNSVDWNIHGQYVRNDILKNGSTNFNEPYIDKFHKILPEDKVTLYCSKHGYFGGHYYSSLEILASTNR